jgi:hypothetical protein
VPILEYYIGNIGVGPLQVDDGYEKTEKFDRNMDPKSAI